LHELSLYITFTSQPVGEDPSPRLLLAGEEPGLDLSEEVLDEALREETTVVPVTSTAKTR